MYGTERDDWSAAMAAWNGLTDSQQAQAIGYIASRDPALVAQAADAAGATIETILAGHHG